MAGISKTSPKPFLGAQIPNTKVKSSKVDEIITRLNAITNLEGKLTPSTGTVTQETSITTGVTLNKPSGVITTVSSTLAGGSSTSFTVTNSYVTSSATAVVATITGYSGTLSTNGLPLLLNVTPGSGSFVVNLINIHATNALSGTLKISFTVLS